MDVEKIKQEKKLIYKGKKKNPIIKFWNWGWNIYYKNPELWNYLIVGVLVTIVNVIVKNVLLIYCFDKDSVFETQIAVFIAWFVSVLFAYYPNRKYVFFSKSKKYVKEFVLFILGRLSTYIIDAGITFVFCKVIGLSGILLLIYNVVDQIVVMAGNFIISKIIVFKKETK